MSYTLNKTGAQIDAILNRAEAGGQLDLDIAAEAAARAAADALKAPLASPALTGTPTAPTAAPGTDTTQLATTAFANAAAAAAAASAASGKADKVAGATAGNLAGLDASGNLTDAGVAAADVATKADVQNITPKRTASNDPSSSSFSVLCDAAIAGEAKPKLYGKSVVINQLFGSANARSLTIHDVTFTKNANGSYTVTGTASASGQYWLDYFTADASRTYLMTSSNSNIPIYSSSHVTAGQEFKTQVVGGTEYVGVEITSGVTYSGTFSIKVIDLSAIFTAAELAEQTSIALTKAAWLKKYGYPLPQYIGYNTGSIVSNNATYLMHGRNIWDEEWEAGRLDKDTGASVVAANGIRSKNLIKVESNTTYYPRTPYAVPMYGMVICYYDANGNFISGRNLFDLTFTTLSDAAYIKFCTNSPYGITYNHDICINLSDAAFNGTYEPYHNGGSVTADSLNGIGTAVDSQDAEGNIVRRIGSVDLGSLTWDPSSAANTFIGTISDMQPLADYSNARVVCGRYQAVAGTSPDGVPDKAVCQRPHASLRQVYIHDSAYSDAAAFKTAVSGVMLDYILATPTTSTTTPSDLTTQAGYNSLDPVSGDVQSAGAECEYTVDIVAYVDKKFAEL